VLAALPAGIVLAALAGLSDLLGSAVVLTGQRRFSAWFDHLLAFGTGFVLAIAVAELITSGIEAAAENSLWVLAGFSTLYLVDKLLEGNRAAEGATRGVFSGVGLTICGVAICDFFDGLAVASVVTAVGAATGGEGGDSAEISGWLLLAGLFPHNFLEGAGIALVLLAAGVSRGAAWVLVVLLAVATLLGGLAAQMAVTPAVRASIQAFAGGLLLHMVASQRIPGFKGSHEKVQALLVVAGIAAFVLTDALLGALET
jgi:zinc transporter ZupT